MSCGIVRRRAQAMALGALLLGVAIGGCGRGCGNDASAPVAKVGDETFTLGDLQAALRETPSRPAAPEDRWNATEQWVARQLLYREALRRGVDEQPEVALQIKTAVRELVIGAMLDEMSRHQAAVAERDIERYYSQNASAFRRREATVRVREIVVDDPREAQEVYSELRRNPQSLGEIVRVRSTGMAGAESGDLGYVSASTSPEIWQAVQQLGVNQISQPVRASDGLHILMVVDRRSAGGTQSLDEVRMEIANRIRAMRRLEAMTALVEELKARESYKIYEDRLGPRTSYAGAQDTSSILRDVEAGE